MKYYVPYCLHVPVTSPPTGLDGFGNVVSGYQHPQFDTLFGIANPNSTSMDVTLKVFNASGVQQLWGSSPTKVITLAPSHSLAMTFIAGNPLPDPPQNFQGYAIIELSKPGAIYSMLGGGGYFPNHWNTFSAEVPLYVDEPNGLDARTLTARSRFTFPYSIPYFQDLNHDGDRSYRTSMSLTNFDVQACYVHATFTVADYYSVPGGAGAGTEFRVVQQLAAGQMVARVLYDWLLEGGYPAGTNFEGWVKIELRTGPLVSDPLIALKVVPYMLISNAAFDLFSAGQPFL